MLCGPKRLRDAASHGMGVSLPGQNGAAKNWPTISASTACPNLPCAHIFQPMCSQGDGRTGPWPLLLFWGCPTALRPAGGRAQNHDCLHCPIRRSPIDLRSWQAPLALCMKMPRLAPEAPHFYKPPPQNEEPGTARGAADWPPRIDIPPHPKNLGATLSFGGGKRKCVCVPPPRSPAPKIMGRRDPAGGIPVPSSGRHPRLCSPSFLHALFSCVPDHVSARREGQTY